MKITPIEIRQHTFDKGLRGYKPEDVDAFLVSLSQEWERVTGEYKMLKMQLELAEKELGKLKEVEMTLFRTLKTAEDTSVQITDQANKAAEQYLSEARQKSDDLLADARKRSALMVQDAENQSRYLKDNILNDLKAMEHDFKALENYKENLAVQIRAIASNAVDSIERFEKKFAKQNLKGKIEEVAAQIQNDSQPTGSETKSEPDTSTEPVNPATDLPPLTQREESIPEAIPMDDTLVNKLNDAVHQTEHRDYKPESTPTTDEQPAAPESNVSDSEPVSSETKAVETEEQMPIKKGGSFFDQI